MLRLIVNDMLGINVGKQYCCAINKGDNPTMQSATLAANI